MVALVRRAPGVGFPPPWWSSFAGMHEETIRAADRGALRAAGVEEQPGRYLASFENRFGEPLVFVYDDGERDAMVFLGDADWQSYRVSDAGGRPRVADVILSDEERAFLDACWQATAWQRERADRVRA